MFNTIKAIGKINKVLRGGSASISDSELVVSFSSLQKAKPYLDNTSFDKACSVYREISSSKQERLYKEDVDLLDRVVHIATAYSYYCDYNAVINPPDARTEFYLSRFVPLNVNKRKEIINFLTDYPGKVGFIASIFDKDNFHPLPYYLSSLYFYQAIVSILINGNNDIHSLSLNNYMNREYYAFPKEMLFWQGIKSYRDIAGTMLKSYSPDIVDRSIKISTYYFTEFEKIMSSGMPIDVKCNLLGLAMYKINGISIADGDSRKRMVDDTTKEFIDFVLNFNA